MLRWPCAGIYLYHLQSTPGSGITLELHYRFPDSLLSIKHLDWFWGQTQMVEADKFAFIGLKPEAHLLYLSAHAILQHGEAGSNMRQYFDIHRLIHTYPLDWNLVIGQASLLGWSSAVERALTLAHRFFDTQVPKSVCSALRENQFEGENAFRAFQLQAKGKAWEKNKVAVVAPFPESPLPLFVSFGLSAALLFARGVYDSA